MRVHPRCADTGAAGAKITCPHEMLQSSGILMQFAYYTLLFCAVIRTGAIRPVFAVLVDCAEADQLAVVNCVPGKIKCNQNIKIYNHLSMHRYVWNAREYNIIYARPCVI